jgi:hypothetical protein
LSLLRLPAQQVPQKRRQRQRHSPETFIIVSRFSHVLQIKFRG